MISFAVLRIAPVSRGALSRLQAHIAREYRPDNSDESRTKNNLVLFGTGHPVRDFEASRFSSMRTYKKTVGAPVGAEMILTAAADWFEAQYPGWKSNPSTLEPWIEAQRKFLQERYGEHCVTAVVHLDEEAPHVHALIVPTHRYQWKQPRREGKPERITEKEFLSYGDEFSDRQADLALARKRKDSNATKLGRLQTAYADAVHHLGLRRGLNRKYRQGTAARHESTSAFYKRLDSTLADARRNVPRLKRLELAIPPKPGPTDVFRLREIAEQLERERVTVNKVIQSTNLRLEQMDAIVAKNRMLTRDLGNVKAELIGADAENQTLRAEIDALKPKVGAMRSLSPERVIAVFEVPALEAQRIQATMRKWNAIDFVAVYEQVKPKQAIALLAEKFPADCDALSGHAVERAVDRAQETVEATRREVESDVSTGAIHRELTKAETVKADLLAKVFSALPPNTTLDITAHDHSGTRTRVVRKSASEPDAKALVPLLSRENATGRSIIALPRNGQHSILLLDDATPESLDRMRQQTGIEPGLVVQTSPASQQALIVAPAMDGATMNRVFRKLNAAYGDPKIVGAAHSFKLPGFAQRKPKHANIDGTGPWVRLLSVTPFQEISPAVRAYTEAELQHTLQARRDLEADQPRAAQPPATAKPFHGQSPLSAARYEEWKRIVEDRYAQALETFGPDVDWSKVDCSIARFLARQEDIDGEAARSLMFDCSPNLLERHPGGQGAHHVAKTLGNAGLEPAEGYAQPLRMAARVR